MPTIMSEKGIVGWQDCCVSAVRVRRSSREENILIGNVVPLRCDQWRSVLQRRRWRAICCSQFWRDCGSGGRWRSWLRIHDERLGGGTRLVRTQLRGRHERRHCIRPSTRRVDFTEKRCNLASVDLEPIHRDEKMRTSFAIFVKRHYEFTDSPRAKWILENWDDNASTLHQDIPARVQARAGRRPRRGVRTFRAPAQSTMRRWRLGRCTMG